MPNDPKPPEGYDTWLDYAVFCLSLVTRMQISGMLDPDKNHTVEVFAWRKHDSFMLTDVVLAELTKLRADAEAYRFLCKQNIKALRHLERDIETRRRDTERTTKGIEP